MDGWMDVYVGMYMYMCVSAFFGSSILLLRPSLAYIRFSNS